MLVRRICVHWLSPECATCVSVGLVLLGLGFHTWKRKNKDKATVKLSVYIIKISIILKMAEERMLKFSLDFHKAGGGLNIWPGNSKMRKIFI